MTKKTQKRAFVVPTIDRLDKLPEITFQTSGSIPDTDP